MTGCSLIDEDQSDCQNDFELDYQLRLVTNITTELETELSLQADLEIRGLLETYLKTIFTDYASDVDLSFYDTAPPMERLHHISDEMNGNESSYTLHLPVHEYRHTAVANIRKATNVVLEGSENCSTGRLVEYATKADPIPVQTTGLFTARKDIDVLYGIDQHFDVRLYMANAASALVVNLAEAPSVESLDVTVKGFATAFNISDSTYVFNGDPTHATREIDSGDALRRVFASVHFPSRDKAEGEEDAIWYWIVKALLKDGTTTLSLLKMDTPLPAGQLKILTADVQDNGVVTPEDLTVAVSVKLDWHEGMHFETEF